MAGINPDDFAGMGFDSLVTQANAAPTNQETEPASSADLNVDSQVDSPYLGEDINSQVQAYLDAEGDGEEDNSSEAEIEASADVSESGELSNDLPQSTDDSNSDIEEVMIAGNNGRKQRLKIDYADKKAIKQAYLKAAGMRKFQAERDEALQNFTATKKEFEALNEDWNSLESAFKEGGIKGLVTLLSNGDEDAWSTAVDEELQHREYLKSLSPEEKFRMELEKRDQVANQKLQAEQARREKFEQEIREREERAAFQELESKLIPSFDRYRFEGKLGDEIAEAHIDEAIWDAVGEELAELPEDVNLTQAMIDKTFRKHSDVYRRIIKVQADNQTKRTLEKKKVDSAKRASVVAKKGLAASTDQKRALKNLMSGDLSGALSTLWSK